GGGPLVRKRDRVPGPRQDRARLGRAHGPLRPAGRRDRPAAADRAPEEPAADSLTASIPWPPPGKILRVWTGVGPIRLHNLTIHTRLVYMVPVGTQARPTGPGWLSEFTPPSGNGGPRAEVPFRVAHRHGQLQ